MGSIGLLERVGEPSWRQRVRREPAAEIGKRSRDCRKGDADQREPCERAGLAEARPRDSSGFFEVDRHVPHLPFLVFEERMWGSTADAKSKLLSQVLFS